MSRLRFASLDMTTHSGNYWGMAVGGFATNRHTLFLLVSLPVMSTKGACARMETSLNQPGYSFGYCPILKVFSDFFCNGSHFL